MHLRVTYLVLILVGTVLVGSVLGPADEAIVQDEPRPLALDEVRTPWTGPPWVRIEDVAVVPGLEAFEPADLDESERDRATWLYYALVPADDGTLDFLRDRDAQTIALRGEQRRQVLWEAYHDLLARSSVVLRVEADRVRNGEVSLLAGETTAVEGLVEREAPTSLLNDLGGDYGNLFPLAVLVLRGPTAPPTARGLAIRGGLGLVLVVGCAAHWYAIGLVPPGERERAPHLLAGLALAVLIFVGMVIAALVSLPG